MNALNPKFPNLFPDNFIDWAWSRLVCYLGIATSTMVISFSFVTLLSGYNKIGFTYITISVCLVVATVKALGQLDEIPTEYDNGKLVQRLETIYHTAERAETYPILKWWYRTKLIKQIRYIDAAIQSLSVYNVVTKIDDTAKFRSLYNQYMNAGDADYIKIAGDIALSHLTQNEARRAYERALDLYQRNADMRGAAEALKGIGDVDVAESAYTLARIVYLQALELHQKTANLLGVADLLKAVGDAEAARPNHREARLFYEEAIWTYSKYEEAANQDEDVNANRVEYTIKGKIYAFQALIQVLIDHADYKVAEEICVREINKNQNISNVAAFEKMLGDVYIECSRYLDAWRRYGIAAEHYRRQEDREGELAALAGLKQVIAARFHL